MSDCEPRLSIEWLVVPHEAVIEARLECDRFTLLAHARGYGASDPKSVVEALERARDAYLAVLEKASARIGDYGCVAAVADTRSVIDWRVDHSTAGASAYFVVMPKGAVTLSELVHIVREAVPALTALSQRIQGRIDEARRCLEKRGARSAERAGSA